MASSPLNLLISPGTKLHFECMSCCATVSFELTEDDCIKHGFVNGEDAAGIGEAAAEQKGWHHGYCPSCHDDEPCAMAAAKAAKGF